MNRRERVDMYITVHRSYDAIIEPSSLSSPRYFILRAVDIWQSHRRPADK
jgi:hypothetical protein